MRKIYILFAGDFVYQIKWIVAVLSFLLRNSNSSKILDTNSKFIELM